MGTNAAVSQEYEQILNHIIRVLPPNRAEQLVDFARFLEAQVLTEKLTQAETAAALEDDNARWDALLATDESQSLLEKLANEALGEHRAGKTKPMTINNAGQIAPG